MSPRALHRRVAGLARRQAEAAEQRAATAAIVDAGHAERVAFLVMAPEDLRLAVGVALADPARCEHLSGRACFPFAPWATPAPGFQFPRALVEWILHPPRSWFLGHCCERCGLGVLPLTTWSNDPDPPPSIVVFPACPACGGKTTFMAAFEPGHRHEPPPPGRAKGGQLLGRVGPPVPGLGAKSRPRSWRSSRTRSRMVMPGIVASAVACPVAWDRTNNITILYSIICLII